VGALVVVVSVFFVAFELFVSVSRACSLDGDVLGLILGGMTVVIGLLSVTSVNKAIRHGDKAIEKKSRRCGGWVTVVVVVVATNRVLPSFCSRVFTRRLRLYSIDVTVVDTTIDYSPNTL
jgi:hypothetical protein